jgi:RHS repeat-associated protein
MRGSYTFNAREQVTSWTRPPPSNVVTEYGLNGSGSIVTQATTGQPTITYEYEADGQRLKAAVENGVRTTYRYAPDGFGEITGYGLEGQDPVAKYEYDAFGRMKASEQGGSRTTYSYDGLDRRDTKTESGGRIFDLSYVGKSEALSQEQQFGGQGELRSYDYTGNGLERLGTARKTSASTAFYRAYMTDAAGSVEGLENDQGNLIGTARYSYDPYGAQLTEEGSLAADAKANPFRFEGHYYDSETKLYDMRARSYLPERGRFLGEDRYEDPLADQALEADPLTQDRYLFAGGNPVDNVEFDGHEPITSYNPRGRQKMVDRSGTATATAIAAISSRRCRPRRPAGRTPTPRGRASERLRGSTCSTAPRVRTWLRRPRAPSGALRIRHPAQAAQTRRPIAACLRD